MNFLETLTDDELEMFLKAADDVKAFLIANEHCPDLLPNEFVSLTPQGFQATIMKKLLHASGLLNKLILELRIDIARYIRFLFACDDDRQCSLLFFTFGFEKQRHITDYLTNTYSLHTKEALSRYSANKMIKGCDYDGG